jgi:hypothetical protein
MAACRVRRAAPESKAGRNGAFHRELLARLTGQLPGGGQVERAVPLFRQARVLFLLPWTDTSSERARKQAMPASCHRRSYARQRQDGGTRPRSCRRPFSKARWRAEPVRSLRPPLGRGRADGARPLHAVRRWPRSIGLMLGAEAAQVPNGARGRLAFTHQRVAQRARPRFAARACLAIRSTYGREPAPVWRGPRAGSRRRLVGRTVAGIGGRGSFHAAGHRRRRSPASARWPMEEVMRGQRTDALPVPRVGSSL